MEDLNENTQDITSDNTTTEESENNNAQIAASSSNTAETVENNNTQIASSSNITAQAIQNNNVQIVASDNITTTNEESDANRQVDATDKVKKAMNVLKNKVISAMNIISGKLLTFGKSAFSAAESFNTAMGQIGTIANTTKVPITKLQNEIVALSNNTGASATAIANNVYKVIAAGVSTSQSVKFVATASELASISYGNVSDSMKFLLNVMNGYGIKAKNITSASNDLIVTQKNTKMTFDSVAKAMKGVEGKAKNAGINLANVGASLIALKKSGESSSSSVKNLKLLMGELGNSSSKVNKAFKKASGQSFKQLSKSGHTLYESLKKLYGQQKGNEKNFKALFKSAKAGNAAWAILNQGSESFTKSLKKMSKASNATGKSWKKVSQTAEVSMKKAQAAVKNAMIKVGEALIPFIKILTNLINKFAKFAQKINPQVATVVAAIGLTIIAFNKVYTTISTLKDGLKGLWIVVEANPLMAIITVITMVGVALYECYKHVAWFRNMVNDAWDEIKSIFSSAMSGLQWFKQEWSSAWNYVGAKFTNISNSILSGISGIRNKISSFVDWVRDAFSSVGREASHIYDSFKSMFLLYQIKKLV